MMYLPYFVPFKYFLKCWNMFREINLYQEHSEAQKLSKVFPKNETKNFRNNMFSSHY